MNIHRDSYASYIGHYPMLAYFAIAQNESIGRERYNFLQVSFIYLFYFVGQSLVFIVVVIDKSCLYIACVELLCSRIKFGYICLSI